MRRRALLIGLVAVTIIGTACTGSSNESNSFALTEFSISGPSSIGSGGSVLTATNAGEFAHTLVVTTDLGVVVGATDLIQPGETAELDADLPSGKYQITCRIVAQTEDGTLVDHYEAGMNQMLEVVDG